MTGREGNVGLGFVQSCGCSWAALSAERAGRTSIFLGLTYFRQMSQAGHSKGPAAGIQEGMREGTRERVTEVL